MLEFKDFGVNQRLILLALVGASFCSAQQVVFSFPPELKQQGITAFAIGSNQPLALSFETSQSERLRSCSEMIPYLIGILNQSGTKIESVVVRMVVFEGLNVSRVSVNEMKFGTTNSTLLIVAPRSDVSAFLNPSPIPSTRSLGSSVCSDTARSMQLAEGVERMEINLDSITFADGTVTGEDRFGVLLRSEKRLQALRDIVGKVSAAKATLEQLKEAMEATISSTARAFDLSLRGPFDFYSRESHAFARMILLELKNGTSVQDIEASLQRHLSSDGAKEVLRRRAP